ncbi:ankyrin repeat protein [Teladorsagia circumcincta]|uniref:Ankyrin repeat protein n=1 Tax=Teladorsagia circumcincta TaxID=45464 RepID=A0A2G9U172_TELCI|nr:ankyrin repeat protein [Teladorsagia circumcincta]
MVAFLLEQNANKDCQDYECCTPLHLAASEDHVEPAKELLKVGASVMLRNDKCAKVLMARHMRNTRAPLGSPKSTQSTPTRCTASSPYNHSGTPHSVAAFGSNYSSPQYPNPMINLLEAPLPSPSSHQSARYSAHGHQPLCGSVAPSAGVVVSSICVEGQVFPTSREKTMVTSPGFFDSGFGTMTDRSSYDRSGPWSGSDGFPKSNERIESAHEWLADNGGYIV